MKMILLKNRQHKVVGKAIVDDDNYLFLSKLSWSLQATGYPQAWDKRIKKTRTMHQIILGLDCGYKGRAETDHLNRNKLDNRKDNLRLGNRTTNSRNQTEAQHNSTTGHLNVHKVREGRYQVRIFGKYYGYFKDIEKAAAYAKKQRLKLLSLEV